MPRSDAASVATSCLQAWTTGDFATARSLLHDDVTFVGPLGTTEGADEYIRGVRGTVPDRARSWPVGHLAAVMLAPQT